jgi:hypothetical protein
MENYQMVVTDMAEPTLEGSKAEKELGKTLLTVFRGYGRFMSAHAPIRISLGQLAEFLKSMDGSSVSENSIRTVVEKNPGAFQFEEIDGEQFVVSTRLGTAPLSPAIDRSHTFGDRFMSPPPKPDRSAAPLRPRPRGETTWSTLERVLSDLDSTEGDYSERRMREPDTAAIVSQIMDGDGEAQAEEPAAATTVAVPVEQPVDVAGMGDAELAQAVRTQLEKDERVARFGERWMIEDQVPRLSRGDLRRIKDYIEEQEQPLADEVLVQDVLEVRPRQSDYEIMRFALNYRLAAEHRDFEFVGTNQQRFWSVSSLPAIGTTRRKATEIGSDYRFMLEELSEKPAYRSVSQLSHVLSFYEFYHGLLPYDAEMQALLPATVLSGQRTTVFTFECPQSYTTYLVELRHPTPNRGGYLLGLDDFFSENLVPGALITIKASDNDGHFIVEYEETEAQSYRLLELEDRRQRYLFRPTSFNCLVFEEYLLDEDRFPGFAGDKPVDDKARRKPETVVSRSFERRASELEGGGFGATFAELLAASNVERPFSERFLRAILEGDESGAFAKDPDRDDAYTYIPGSTG